MKTVNPELSNAYAERDFRVFMQKADDFFKIELLRPARSWYVKALKFNIDTEIVQQKISECDRLLAFERKIVRLLLVIFSALIVSYLIFFR